MSGGRRRSEQSYVLTAYSAATLTTSPMTSPSSTLQQCPPTATAPCNLQPLDMYKATGNTNSFTLPTHIAYDSTADAVWITDNLGSEIDEINLGDYQVSQYPLRQSSNPWQIVVDANYVYAVDFAARNLVRLNKFTGAINYVPLPRTSDTEQSHSLALASNGDLYFTLSDDHGPSSLGASTFGYVNIAAWENTSSQCTGGIDGTDCAPAPTDAVVYTGLDTVTDPGGGAHFRGIAVDSGGDIALADFHQVVRLTSSD